MLSSLKYLRYHWRQAQNAREKLCGWCGLEYKGITPAAGLPAAWGRDRQRLPPCGRNRASQPGSGPSDITRDAGPLATSALPALPGQDPSDCL